MNKMIYAGILFLALFTTRAMAQTSPIRFGIRAGLNVADWQGQATQSASSLLALTNGTVSQQPRQGFHIGAYASIPLSQQFTLEPGLQYSQKGTQLRGNFSSEALEILNVNTTVTNQAAYLDVPLLARFYVTKGFNIYAGPQVSFLLADKLRTKASVLGFSVLNRNMDVSSSIRPVDVALTGGIGYRFENGFNLGLGYDYGLNTIDQRGNFSTYNRVMKASIGFEF
jgi:hypothetical protein